MNLTTGLQVFHNGTPIELLHMLTSSTNGELWRVRPLFVEEPDRDVFILSSDRLRKLHSQGNA